MLIPVVRKLSLLLLAPRCLVCSETGQGGLDLCGECTAALPWSRAVCRQCALPLPLPGQADVCASCLLAPPPYARTQAAFRYAFPVDRLLPRFKFHADLAAGAVLASLMHRSLDLFEPPEVLIPVPLHATRLRQRGYDQALELAKALSRSCRVPLCGNRLLRHRRTAAQTELGASARQDNVRGAFALRAGPALPAHVALVDDVMTTGATVAECARLLLAAGVQRVDIWAVARAI